MPIYQKIKVVLYIILWPVLASLTSLLLASSGLGTLISIILGFAVCTSAGLWLLYMFYPKMDLFSSISFNRSKRMVSLTFDDGPTKGFTESILKVLSERAVHATFFMIGKKIEENRSAAIMVLKAGHEIGCHTYTHKKLHFSNISEIDSEVKKSFELVRGLYEEAGRSSDYKPLFRAPHGFKNVRLKLYLMKKGISLVPWTRGVWDTSSPGEEWIVSKATASPRINEIILLHDGKGLEEKIPDEQQKGVLLALPKIIDFYRNKGYTFTKVSDFIR